MIPGCQALAATGQYALRSYGKNAAQTAVTAFYNQRTVTNQTARLFTSKSPDNGQPINPDDCEKFEIERFKRKIGRAGGLQNIVRLSYYPKRILSSYAALLTADILATACFPAVELGKITLGIDPGHPIFFAILAGVAADIRYTQGHDRAISAIHEDSTLKEVKQEFAVQEACLSAQLKDISLDESGTIEYESFKSLGLDFESPLTRQDVLKAYEEKPEEHYAKVRLLGEHKE